MPSPIITTNFKSSDGLDLGEKLITKDYLLSVYPHLVPHLVTPELWIWGAYKQVSGTFTQLSTAIPIDTNSNWKQTSFCKYGLVNSIFHAGAIKSNGTLWTWGDNNNGQLGLGSIDSNVRTLPFQVGSDTNWKQIACGSFHTVAIKTDGTIWSWGRNSEGQLGLGTPTSPNTTNRSSPVQIGSGTDWKYVAAGYRATYAIKTDGTLWSWGTNYGLALGLGQSSDTYRITYPSQIGSDNTWKFIDCHTDHVMAIKSDGTMWSWGRNSNGQLGLGDFTSRSSPNLIGSDTDWKQVSCGFRHTSAIKTNGRLYSCGTNSSGALGINSSSSTDYSSFVEVYNKSFWKQVSCGFDFTCAIRMDGAMWSWGNNRDNQLGNQNYTNSSYSYVVFPIENTIYSKNWKQVSCGPFHVASIKSFEFI